MRDPQNKDHAQSQAELLKRIDDHIFLGEGKFLNLFKKFDKDSDGYVSRTDLEKHLRDRNLVHSEEELAHIMNYVDKEKKGFLTFRDFNKKLRRNMTNVDEKWEQKERNISQPMPAHTDMRLKTMSDFYKKTQDLKKSFKPDNFFCKKKIKKMLKEKRDLEPHLLGKILLVMWFLQRILQCICRRSTG